VDGAPLMGQTLLRSDAAELASSSLPTSASLPPPHPNSRPMSRRGSALSLNAAASLAGSSASPPVAAGGLQRLGSSKSLQPELRRSSLGLGAALGSLAASTGMAPPGQGAHAQGGAVQGLLPGTWSLPIPSAPDDAAEAAESAEAAEAAEAAELGSVRPAGAPQRGPASGRGAGARRNSSDSALAGGGARGKAAGADALEGSVRNGWPHWRAPPRCLGPELLSGWTAARCASAIRKERHMCEDPHTDKKTWDALQ